MLSMFQTAYVESHYNNLSCGDKDSVGVFQQRPSQGWGSYSQIMNVEYSTDKYLDRAIQINKERPGLAAGNLAQAVQVSEFPTRYNEVTSIARDYLNQAISRNGGSSGNGGSTNVGTKPGSGSNSGSGSSGSGSGSGSSGSTSGCAKTVTIKSGNTCSGVAKSAGISLSTLYSLNKGINSGCTNLQVNQKVCVQKGSGSTSSAKPSSGKASVPGNIASGTTKSCSKYYTVAKGNTCSALASKGGISLSSLYTLNSGINKSSCNNLQVGKAYCISA